MAVKEALDNSLDACEEFSILPEISISIDRQGGDVFTVTVADNGPGIKRRFIPEVFGRLLYGSRFHSFRQSRGGQQGIGITAAVLYGQISTGQPSRIVSKTEDEDVGYEVVMGIDVARNRADIHSEKPVIVGFEHGTVVSMPLRGGRYQTGRQSVLEYVRQTAVANPHMEMRFRDPDGKVYVFHRSTGVAPAPPKQSKPYLRGGLEAGEIRQLAQASPSNDMLHFLTDTSGG